MVGRLDPQADTPDLSHPTRLISMPDPNPNTTSAKPAGPGRKAKADQFWGRGEPMVWVAGGALAADPPGRDYAAGRPAGQRTLPSSGPRDWRNCSLPTDASSWAGG